MTTRVLAVNIVKLASDANIVDRVADEFDSLNGVDRDLVLGVVWRLREIAERLRELDEYGVDQS